MNYLNYLRDLKTWKHKRPNEDRDIKDMQAVQDWARRLDEERYMKHHTDSISLMRYSAQRGMSRSSMVRIWGTRLVSAVLGYNQDGQKTKT
jgi:hypothetical protein